MSTATAMMGQTGPERWTSRVRRDGLTTLVAALVLVVLNQVPVWGAPRVVVASQTTNAPGGALLLAMGAGVLLLGGGAFIALTWSRRKRAPQQCALEREALEVAEQAVRYWEGALAHLHHTAHGEFAADRTSGADEGASRESHASLLEKATRGHAQAVQVRDERQLDLIRCMAAGGAKIPLSPDRPTLEPVIVDADRPTPPPTLQ